MCWRVVSRSVVGDVRYRNVNSVVKGVFGSLFISCLLSVLVVLWRVMKTPETVELSPTVPLIRLH